jgi:hypothetical protein
VRKKLQAASVAWNSNTPMDLSKLERDKENKISIKLEHIFMGLCGSFNTSLQAAKFQYPILHKYIVVTVHVDGVKLSLNCWH